MWLLLAALVAAAPAKDDAEAAFRRGRDFLAKGRTMEACAAFAESQKLDPALGTLINLAECESKLGHAARSYALFDEVLAWSRRKGDKDREQVALDRLASLRPAIALVAVDAPAGSRLLLDGQEISAGAPVPVEPGAHVLERSRDGASPQLTPFRVDAGATLQLPVAEAARAPAPAPALTPAPVEAQPPVVVTHPPATSGQATAGKITFGAGAVLAAAGAVGIALCTSAWQQGNNPRPTISLSSYQQAAQWYPISWAVAGIGLAAMAVGGGLWFFAAPSPTGAQAGIAARF